MRVKLWVLHTQLRAAGLWRGGGVDAPALRNPARSA